MDELCINLLRHGETRGGEGFRGSLDDPLSGRGWQQMATAVEGRGPWERIVSSPLRRCAYFARSLSATLNTPLILDDDWRELHFGQWEGRTAADLMDGHADELGAFWRDPTRFTPPGAEPLAQFHARVHRAWDRVIEQGAGRRILVITHGGPIRIMLCHALAHPLRGLLSIEVPHADLRRLRVCSNGGQGFTTTLVPGSDP